MRQAQAAKQAAYLAAIALAAKPSADKLILLLEGQLRLAIEGTRPVQSVKSRILWTGLNIDPADAKAFHDAILAALAKEYGPPRGYVVSTIPVNSDPGVVPVVPIGLDATLFWA